jgi:hypothetical protein
MGASEAPRRRVPTVILVVAIVVLVLGGGAIILRRFVHHEVERGAKTIEARNRLQELGAAATQAYERDEKVCPSASRLVPAARTGFEVKYLSDRHAWERDAERHAGFACLGFSIQAHYYRYEYVATEDSFTARAYGGDGEWGVFEIRGRVAGGQLVVGPVQEIDPRTPEPPAQGD